MSRSPLRPRVVAIGVGSAVLVVLFVEALAGSPPPEPSPEPAAPTLVTEAPSRRFDGGDEVCRAAAALADLDPLLLRLAGVDDVARRRAADVLDEVLVEASAHDGWADLEAVARRSRAVTEASDEAALAEAVVARGEPRIVAALERVEAACGQVATR